jgi:hypothetical protein
MRNFMQVLAFHCPTCGAPIQLHGADQRHAICIYCSSSVVVGGPGAGPDSAQVAEVQPITKAQIAEVIELLTSGKMDAAVSQYAALAKVSEREATEMIAALPILSKRKLGSKMPMNFWGFVIVSGIALALFGGAFALFANHPGWAVVLLLLGMAWLMLFVGQFISTMVVNFTGERGVATIERIAVVCRNHERADTVVLGMTIHPDGPGEPFYDEEPIMTLKQTVLEKLKPGNKIPVRFSRKRQLVFPLSPITVVGTR